HPASSRRIADEGETMGMFGHGFLLWLQTLLALVALGLAGGWALWPFRRDDRPYLWLAAPLAGVAVLSVTLSIFHFLLRLTIPAALALAAPVLAGPTVFLFVRWRLSAPLPAECSIRGCWRWAVAALAGITAWATLASNWT